MATIGSIAVAFGADLRGLSEGIESSIDLFDDISERIEQLNEELESLSERVVTVRTVADTSDLARARSEVESLTQSSQSANVTVAVSADAAAVSQASAAVEDLSDALGETAAPAVEGRSALASLLVTTARVSAGATALSGAYREVRNATLGYIQASTGAASAADAVAVIQSALRGDTAALATVLSSAASAVRDYASGLFSVDGVSRTLQSAVGAVASAFGITDGAVVQSIQYFSSYITEQLAAAGTHRVLQRSLLVLGQAYNSAANAVIDFITTTSSGASAGRAAASAIDVVVRAATSLDAAYSAVAARVAQLAQRFNIIGPVSAAVGTAFDAIVSTISGLATGATSLSSVFSSIGSAIGSLTARAVALLPSFASVSSSMSALAGVGSALAGSIGTVLASLSLIRGAATSSAAGFASLLAQTLASNVAIGALLGGLSALFAGTSVIAGAAGGAATAIAAMSAAFPLTATLAIAAAVATGRFSDELDRISGQAESVEQMADRFGAPRESIERLRLAAANAGVGLSQLAKGQQAFYTSLSKIKVGQLNVDSVREAKLAFDRLGISLDDVKNRNPDQVFAQVAEKLSAVKDPADRTAIAFDLFGKQGAAILPALKEFGNLAADFKRLGGALSEVDFSRLTSLEDSFDRVKAASANLKTVLLLPFTELQKSLNNVSADLQGGLASALAPLASLLADVTKPLGVIAEVAARVVNIMLRLAGAVANVSGATLAFGVIAELAEYAGMVVLDLLSYVEALVSYIEGGASAIASAMRPAMETFERLGEIVIGLVELFAGNIFGSTDSSARSTATAIIALGSAYAVAVFGTQLFTLAMQSTAVQAVVSSATTAAAWVAGIAIGVVPVLAAGVVALGAFIAGMIATAATAVATAVVAGAAWLIALGPIGLVILGIAAIGAAFAGLYAIGGGIVDFFSSFGEGTREINAATASVEELAAAAEENSKSGLQRDAEAIAGGPQQGGTASVDFGEGARTAEAEFERSRAALTEFGMSFGMTEEQAAAAFEEIRSQAATVVGALRGPSQEEIMQGVSSAREKMGDLIIASAQFGQAGADAAAQSQGEFNKLQQSLADGDITLEDFNANAATLTEDLQKNLDILKDDSPEITLKKNLELYKQLGDAAKEAGKKVREISAGTVVDGKLFPTSDAIKARANQYKNEYVAALEAIKKKQQAGGFAQDLKGQRQQLESDKASGKVTTEQYVQMKAELDQTSAQEQAQIAVENVQRDFDRNTVKIEADVAFADNIRKELETAFLSPVEKFQKELDKVKNNDSLTPEEKDLAEKNLRKQAREGLIGKTATEQFNDRQRDLKQGADAGLISNDEMRNKMLQNLDELANALGIPVNPANQMEVSLSELKTALDKGTISADDYAKGVKAARDKFLADLGIDKPKFEQDNERMAELERQKKDGKISDEEFARGKKSIENNIVGQSAAEKIAEERQRIENGMRNGTVSRGRGEAALRGLDADRRSAAGLDNTPSQQLKLGVDKINDAFGVAGKSMAEIQATLSPAEFKEYQEAVKKNSDAVKESLGVEKTGAAQIAEAREKLRQAVVDGVITEEEKNKALKQQRDSLLSSLGISKSPTQDFEDAVAKIKENAAELSPEETANGLKEAKDKLLSALGIDKAPSEEYADRMKDLSEAALKGRIGFDEFAKGAQAAKDSLLQSLGIPLDPVVQLGQRLKDLDAAFASGAINDEELARGQEEARRSMLPGGEEESPVKKFERDMEAVGRAVEDGLISEEDGLQRQKNLQAQLQEDLKPALDATQQDRRGVEGSDVRSKAGVDTFFRILRGNDNPSLKAQLEIARNTKLLAEAANQPDAAPVIAQLSAR